MRRFITALIFFLAITAPLSAHGDSMGDARIRFMQGSVSLQGSDTNGAWEAASINMPVLQNDTYWVPDDGKVEIQFYGTGYLRADGSTEFRVDSMEDSSGSVQISVQSGRVYVDRTSSAEGSVFEVDTPLAAVIAGSSARFDINMLDSGVTEIAVAGGSVRIDSGSGETSINAGNMLAVSTSGTAEVSSYVPDDAWMSWNASRDALTETRSVSAGYLPPSLSDYGYELDDSGNWRYVSTYGYVWVPIITTPDWAPYRIGRWAWMDDDYVWISSEPWGWVPFHYGRWAFRAGIGWFWVPPSAQQAFWCPGYVAWYYTPTYVSWVPLAPGETYYGYGSYGPGSINLRYVHHAAGMVVTNAYRNARAPHAVSAVSRGTFVAGGEYRRLQIPENPFTISRHIAVERPSSLRPVATPAREVRLSVPEKPFGRISRPGITSRPGRSFTPRQPAGQFRKINLPAPPAGQAREIARPIGSPGPFRRITSPEAPAGQVREVSGSRQPTEQIRHITLPTPPAGQAREIARPTGSPGPFRRITSPEAPAGQIREIARPTGSPGPFRRITPPEAPAGQVREVSRPGQPAGQFRTITPVIPAERGNTSAPAANMFRRTANTNQGMSVFRENTAPQRMQVNREMQQAPFTSGNRNSSNTSFHSAGPSFMQGTGNGPGNIVRRY